MKNLITLFKLIAMIIAIMFVVRQTNAQKFVHITDLHVSTGNIPVMGDYDLDGRNFSKLITQIIAENPAFVLATGDIVHTASINVNDYNVVTDNGNWNAVTDKLILVGNTYYLKNQSTGANSGIPIYFMPGNHDYRSRLQLTYNLEAYNSKISNPPTVPAGYTVVSGTGTAANDYYFYNSNMVIICLDAGKDVASLLLYRGKYTNPETYGLTPDQITLIENACSGVNANKVQIVAMHAPAVNPLGQANCGTDYTGTEVFNGDGILSVDDGTIYYRRTEFFNACNANSINMVLAGHLHQNVVLDYLGNKVANNYVGSGLKYTKHVQTAEAMNGAYRVINVTSPTAYTINDPQRAPNVYPAATFITPTFETYITPAQNYYTKIKTAIADGVTQLKLYVDGVLVGSVSNPASESVIPFSIPEGTTSSILKIEATNSVGTTTTTQPLTILKGGNSFFGNLYLGSQVIITDPQTNSNYKFLFQDIDSNTPRKIYVKVYNSSNTLIDELILVEDVAQKVEGLNLFVLPTNIFIGSGGDIYSEIVIAPYVNPELEILSPTSGTLNDAIVTVSTSYSGKNVPWNSSGAPNVNTSTFRTLNYNGTSTTEETYFWDMTGTAGTRTLTVTLTDILGNTVTESATVYYDPTLNFNRFYDMKSWIYMLSGNGSIDASSGCWDSSEQEYSVAYTVQEIGTDITFRHANSPEGTEDIIMDYQGIADAMNRDDGSTGIFKVLASDYNDLNNFVANCGLPGPIYKYEIVNYIKELVGNSRVWLVESENQSYSSSFPTVDGTIPTVSISTPTSNQIYSIVENNPMNVIDVTGFTADNIHSRKVEMSINDGAWFTIWSGWALNVSWNYQINTSLLFDYNNKISVRAVDSQGNLSAVSTVTGINIVKTTATTSDFESFTTNLGTWTVSGHEGERGSSGDYGEYSAELKNSNQMAGNYSLLVYAQSASYDASWCEVQSPIINKPVYKLRVYNYSYGYRVMYESTRAYFIISDGTNSIEKRVTNSISDNNNYFQNAYYDGYYTTSNGKTFYYYDFTIPSNWNKNNITIKLGSYAYGSWNSSYAYMLGYWDVIVVEDGIPSASISAYPTLGTAPLNVSFAAIASDKDGIIQSYSWNFGDGTTATEKNPTHIYNSIGTKIATLTVTDNEGFTKSNTTTINVSNSIPVASITSITPNPASKGVAVSFSGSGTDANGTISAYEWSTSAGVFSTSQNPSYSGLSEGTQTIFFRVKDNNSTWSDKVSGTLIITPLSTVTTTTVSSITQTTAASGGNVTDAGSSSVTARGVCWSTSSNPTTANSKTSNGTGTGSFASSITGLTAGTTYYVRAYATSSAGTAYGSQITFTTTSASTAPTVTTNSITSITQTTATSGGNVTSAGSSSVTARGVCWSTSSNPTISNSKTNNGTGTGSFTSSITGLTEGTTYYVRAYSTNSVGTSYGSQISFTTTSASVASTYYEDFTDGIANNISAISGDWAVESNQYSQSSTTNSNTIASVPVTQSGKYVYQWKINFITNTSAGMHFMCDASSSTNRGNSYLVFQTNTMLQIYESVGNVLTKKAEASCTAANGDTHSYYVIYDPATGIINAYRDGSTTPIVSWTDSTPLTSGSYISLRTNSTHAHFDNISVDYALYTEDFIDGIANNFVTNAGTWAVESNQYSQSSTTNTNTIASVPVIQYGKLVYEWKTSFITNTSAGMHIMCDASTSTNRGNSYLVFQTYSKLQIYESVGNVLTKKSEASCTAATGQSHTYKVIYDPATGLITAYRDGGTTAIVSWTDSTPLTVGSYISLRTNSTHAHFDDLSVNIYNNSTKSALEENKEVETEITYNCFPNPFSSDLNISYTVTDDSDVLIEIYDFTGKIISKVVDENQVAGNYNVTWDSDETLTNGIYFCRIVVNGKATTSKIMLVK